MNLLQPADRGAARTSQSSSVHPARLDRRQSAHARRIHLEVRLQARIHCDGCASTPWTTPASGSCLGSAPVEKDGSLYVHVPGDAPLQFELLNSAGKTLQKESGWMWTRKSEQRICVGCHAGPEHAPENAVPAILNRSTTPADLTTSMAKAPAPATPKEPTDVHPRDSSLPVFLRARRADLCTSARRGARSHSI